MRPMMHRVVRDPVRSMPVRSIEAPCASRPEERQRGPQRRRRTRTGGTLLLGAWGYRSTSRTRGDSGPVAASVSSVADPLTASTVASGVVTRCPRSLDRTWSYARRPPTCSTWTPPSPTACTGPGKTSSSTSRSGETVALRSSPALDRGFSSLVTPARASEAEAGVGSDEPSSAPPRSNPRVMAALFASPDRNSNQGAQRGCPRRWWDNDLTPMVLIGDSAELWLRVGWRVRATVYGAVKGSSQLLLEVRGTNPRSVAPRWEDAGVAGVEGARSWPVGARGSSGSGAAEELIASFAHAPMQTTASFQLSWRWARCVPLFSPRCHETGGTLTIAGGRRRRHLGGLARDDPRQLERERRRNALALLGRRRLGGVREPREAIAPIRPWSNRWPSHPSFLVLPGDARHWNSPASCGQQTKVARHIRRRFIDSSPLMRVRVQGLVDVAPRASAPVPADDGYHAGHVKSAHPAPCRRRFMRSVCTPSACGAPRPPSRSQRARRERLDVGLPSGDVPFWEWQCTFDVPLHGTTGRPLGRSRVLGPGIPET